MPRRNDIHKILLIGSGPIIIGQACEFDYSGTQACKALREEGYEVVLVNSNPATIMTDPEMADRTYIEPLTWEIVAKVIEIERPDALLPTLGGQTGLNLAMDLARHGVLEKYGVEMIGATAEVIDKAEERDQFKAAMEKIGLEVLPRRDGHQPRGRPPRGAATSACRAWCGPASRSAAPARASPTTATSSTRWCSNGLELSPIHQVLLEESVIGWKEYEMEVMRDADDNVVIICSIENFDPMGVHTGDSITVAPAQTLDRQGIPADARRLDGRDPRDRRRDGRLEHPVRHRSEERPDGGDRDESPREPQQCVGLEGHRLSHRQNRRQTGRRLPPARTAQRHHARDAWPASSRRSTTW